MIYSINAQILYWRDIYEYAYIYFPTILLLKLIKAQSVTIISSSKSIWVRGTIFCRMQNFLILPITLILTIVVMYLILYLTIDFFL